MTRPKLLAGPFLRFGKADLNQWSGTAMVVTQELLEGPTLTVYLHAMKLEFKYEAQLIYNHNDCGFWRFSICLPVHFQNVLCYSYKIDLAGDFNFQFHVPPGNAKSWRWAFTSCNGFSEDVSPDDRKKVGGEQPLWDDLMRRHSESPFFALVGGGDQIYADAIWELPVLKNWLALSGIENRRDSAWTLEMEEAASEFYFNKYCECFTLPALRDAFASIPTINMLDDHDLWDGAGSHPDYLEQSQVFLNLKRVAYKFYLLFQHQVTAKLAENEDYIGAKYYSYSILKMLGSEQALLALDCRAERTIDRIISAAVYEEIFAQIENLPLTVRHLAVVTGVPVLYPRLSVLEHGLHHFGVIKRKMNTGFNKISHAFEVGVKKVFGHQMKHSFRQSIRNFKIKMGKTGMLSSAVDQFGEPDLSNDLIDQWANEHHLEERYYLISKLQDFAFRKGVRVTFVAGDVHLACVGRLSNPENESDHRLMFQITSSAVVNIPPPIPVIMTVDKASSGSPVAYDDKVPVEEELINLFQIDVDESTPIVSTKLMGRRNWCLVEPIVNTDVIEYKLMIENIDFRKPTVAYTVEVPGI